MVSLGADTFICPGSQIFIDAGFGYSSYAWIPGGGNVHFITVDQPGTYSVIVSDADGCTAASSKYVREFCPVSIYVPSAFSPNKDHVNDNFYAFADGVIDFHMYIFDRWGELVFESQDIAYGWDGTYLGHDAPVGSYVYRVDYKLYEYLELQLHTKCGVVSLLR